MTVAPPSAQTRLRDIAREALARWRNDPVRFAHEALGVTRIWSRQSDLLLALVEHDKVAVRSGQKTSKTYSLAILAIWWALTRPRSIVILLAPSQHHLEHVLWGELQRLRRESLDRSTTDADGNPRRPPIAPLGGDCSVSAMSGWEFSNGSKIIGFVTSDAQRIRGISGADNLYILDESTAIPDSVWASVDGNLAGGGRVIAVSNPVINTGWYAAAFGGLSTWHRIAISSIEASEVDPPIRGLATKRFIENKRIEWGEGSPEWSAKILGEFPPKGADGVIPRGLVVEAQKRWRPAPSRPTDPLVIGVDPASKGRDSTAIVARRGSWAAAPVMLQGEDTYAIVDKVVEVIEANRRPNEKAHVNVDGVNNGIGVFDRLRHEHAAICTVSNLESSQSSPDPACSRLRDALWLSLRTWLQGGAIPPDVALADDLTAPLLGYDVKLKYKVEDKLSMRKRLGRSTDRADALALAAYDAPVPQWSPVILNRSTRGY
jgi:hypothetical protein